MKDKETVAKEFEEKFKPIADGGDFHHYDYLAECLLPFLHSQRVADLEAVMGMIKELAKEHDPMGGCSDGCDLCDGFHRALSDLLAKLEEFKGKMR